MLKKIIPLFAVVLLAACAHGPGTCTKCPDGGCKCAQSTCKCAEGNCKCADGKCAEKKNESKKSDCPKCRESERMDEEKRYN